MCHLCGGGLWGRTGPSIGADGTIYTPTGDGRSIICSLTILGVTKEDVGECSAGDENQARASRRICWRDLACVSSVTRSYSRYPSSTKLSGCDVIGHGGLVLSVYDKIHLVPFGEYLPLQDLLERLGLVQLTKVRGGFIPGERRHNQPAPGAPNFLPLICYEIIFPGDAVPRREQEGWLYRHVGRYLDWPSVAGNGGRPGWLLNVTNDGWFGASAGPYQHFQQARVRAIEEGLPLVRAANSGISAVVDPLGRIINSLPLGSEGVFDAPLPQPIAPTPYVRLGDGPLAAAVARIFLWALRLRWRRRSR